MTPIFATLVILANGFSIQLENGCLYHYQQLNENQANIYVCGEIYEYIYKGKHYKP